LSRASTFATRRSASAAATAVVSERVDRSACGRRGRTMIEASKLVPAGARQLRPLRPRPASCWSATTTVRSAAPRSAGARAADWGDPAVSGRPMTPVRFPPSVTEPAEARDGLGAHGFLLGEPLPLLGHDLGGGALGEVWFRQLRFRELDPFDD